MALLISCWILVLNEGSRDSEGGVSWHPVACSTRLGLGILTLPCTPQLHCHLPRIKVLVMLPRNSSIGKRACETDMVEHVATRLR